MRLALRTATEVGPKDGVANHSWPDVGCCPGSGGVATGCGAADKYGAAGPGMVAARVVGRNRSMRPRKCLRATIRYQAKNPAPAIASPRNNRFRNRRNASPPKPE